MEGAHKKECNAIYAVYRKNPGYVKELITFCVSKEIAVDTATKLVSEEEIKKGTICSYDPIDASPEICRMLREGGLI
jgi:histidinol phosphatase-like PHP family hydrolase